MSRRGRKPAAFLVALVFLIISVVAGAATSGAATSGSSNAAPKQGVKPILPAASAAKARRGPRGRRGLRGRRGFAGPAGPAGATGPAGPAGPAAASGTAKSDAVVYRSPFGGAVKEVYAKNGLTLLFDCATTGVARIRSSTDHGAVASWGGTVNNLFVAFTGDQPAGPNGEFAITPSPANGDSFIGNVVYTPNGGNPITIIYTLQFNTSQENCILQGTASYS